MALVSALGLSCRQADLRDIFMVLATKGGKQIRVSEIVGAFLLPCLALPGPKFKFGQAVHAWWAPCFPGCGPGQHPADRF